MGNNLLNSIIKIKPSHAMSCRSYYTIIQRAHTIATCFRVHMSGSGVVSCFGWKIYFHLFVYTVHSVRVRTHSRIIIWVDLCLKSVHMYWLHYIYTESIIRWVERKTDTHIPNLLQVFCFCLSVRCLRFTAHPVWMPAKWFGYLRYGCFGCFSFSLILPAFFRIFAFILFSWLV